MTNTAQPHDQAGVAQVRTQPAAPLRHRRFPRRLSGGLRRRSCAYVLIGTYIGFGALAHDFGFGLSVGRCRRPCCSGRARRRSSWSRRSAPAPPLIETALAVCLSGVRLLPMVVSLLPLIKAHGAPPPAISSLPAHLTAISMWIEALRLLPALPREARLAFCNGLGIGFMTAALAGTLLGFYLAGSLPLLLAAASALPHADVVPGFHRAQQPVPGRSAGARLRSRASGRCWSGRQVGLDLLWTGIMGGRWPIGLHRLREALQMTSWRPICC